MAQNTSPKVSLLTLATLPLANAAGVFGGDLALAEDDGANGALYIKRTDGTYLRLEGSGAATNPLLANGSVPLTADWNAGNFEITAQAFTAQDENGKEMWEADGAVATRTLTVLDDALVVMQQIVAKFGTRTSVITDAANKILSRITSTAARTIELFDDAAVPALMAKVTATVAGLRRISVFDEGGVKEIVQVVASNASRSFAILDDGAVARVVIRVAGLLANRVVAIQDEAAIAIRTYQTLAATRTITDATESGVQMLLVTLLNATKSYLYGVGGATPSFKIDLSNTQLKLASTGATPGADGTIVGRWDLTTGGLTIGPAAPNNAAIFEVQSTTQGARMPNQTTVQKNLVGNAAGNVVFDTTLGKLCVNTGAGWQTITSA